MERIKEESVSQVLKLLNVIGYSLTLQKKIVRGIEVEVPAIRIYVSQKIRPLEALAIEHRIPENIEGIKTDVVEIGEVIALAQRLETPFFGVPPEKRTQIWRPAPPGVSIGHYEISAGTFGCLMADAVSGDPLIVSNNHVLANADMREEHHCVKGDMIVQPGPYDIRTGINPTIHKIGELDRWVPVTSNPASDETVDCAAATPYGPNVLSQILDIGDLDDIGRAGSGNSNLYGDFKKDLPLCKSGRTTGYNESKIGEPAAFIKVSGYHGKTCAFRDVFFTTQCAAGGDSGSAFVWKSPERGNVFMGLLFAGSSSITVACKSYHVVGRLNLKLLKELPPAPPPPPEERLIEFSTDEGQTWTPTKTMRVRPKED